MRIDIVQGTSKKGNNYEALKLTIGKWSTLVFPRSNFELEYIKDYLKQVNK